jgi:uncharacterized protein
MTDTAKRYLLDRAREAISCEIEHRRISDVPTPSEVKNSRCGLFVSLHSRETDELRGCVGYIRARRSLDRDIVAVAHQAAFEDHRFPPVTCPTELAAMRIEVSLLSDFEAVSDESMFTLGTHGACVRMGDRLGLLLPQVADGHDWDVRAFLLHVCAKAGTSDECWKLPGAILYRFTAEVFDDDSLRIPY